MGAWKGIRAFIKGCYRTYRESQKQKGREKRDRERLRQRVSFYQRFIRPDDLCFDVGANMGNRTEAFLQLGARVIAVEPQSHCVEVLQQTYGKNPRFNLIPKGLAQKEGQATIHLGNAHTLSSMSESWIQLFPGGCWIGEEVVQTTTLDILIGQFGVPDFCKIDVEGFEYEVLKGLSVPVGMISFEYTLTAMDQAIQSVRHLESIGMVRFNYSEGELMILALPEWVSADEIVDILTRQDCDRTILFGDIYSKASLG